MEDVYARRMMNMEWAVRLGLQMDLDWLLFLDPDELFCYPQVPRRFVAPPEGASLCISAGGQVAGGGVETSGPLAEGRSDARAGLRSSGRVLERDQRPAPMGMDRTVLKDPDVVAL